MKTAFAPARIVLLLICGCFTLIGASSASARDTIQVNSVWKSNDKHKLTITAIDGETFKGLFTWDGIGNAEVVGKIKGNKISWLVKDARVINGDPGGDNFGTLVGERIEFSWHRPDNDLRGTYILFPAKQ